jgi:hypothetical protein
MSDDKNAAEKAIEKATGKDEVGEAVEEAIEEGPSREHAEKNPPSSSEQDEKDSES